MFRDIFWFQKAKKNSIFIYGTSREILIFFISPEDPTVARKAAVIPVITTKNQRSNACDWPRQVPWYTEWTKMASILFHLYLGKKTKFASGAPKNNKNIPYISIWIIFPWLRNMVPYSPVISPVIDSPVMVDFPGGKPLQVARNIFFSTFRVNYMYNSRYCW